MALKSGVQSLVAAVTAVVMLATDLTAQDAASKPAAKYCWRGQPAPACDAFLLTEFNFFRNIVTPTATVRYSFSPDSVPQYVYKIRDAAWNFTWEVGGMKNVTKRSAMGVTVLLGLNEDGGTVGVKARYRRWLNAEGIALDVGAGVRTSEDRRGTIVTDYTMPYRQPGQTAVFTGDIAINARDYAALVTRVDVVKFGGRYQPAIALGVRAGSKPATFATAGLAATYAALFTVFLIAFGGDEFT